MRFSTRAGVLIALVLTLLLIAWIGISVYIGTFTPQPKPTHSQALEILAERRLTSEPRDMFSWSPDGSRLLLSRVEYGNPDVIQQKPVAAEPPITDAKLAILEVEKGKLVLLSQSGIGALWAPDGNNILIREFAGDQYGDSYMLYSLEDEVLYPRFSFPQSGTPLQWMEEVIVYQANDGLWSISIDYSNLGASSKDQIVLAEPIHLMDYDASDPARWSFPAPDLMSFILSDNTDLENRRWWLAQADGTQREMDPALYSLGICCRWSPDGSQLAYFGITSQGQNLYLVDRTGDHKQVLVSGVELGQGAFLTLDFSPDGKQLVFVYAQEGEGFPFDQNQLYIVDVDGSGLRQLNSPAGQPHNWLRWSPDGRYISFEGRDKRVWIAELSMP